MSIKKSILIRVRISFLVVFLFSLAIVYRLATVQFVEGEKWRKLGDQLSLSVEKIPATRGNIYSDNGSLLATSLPYYKVAMDPMVPSDELMEQNIDSLSILLSRFYQDRSRHQYKKKILDARRKKRQYLVLNRQEIGYQEKKMMEDWPIFRNGQLRGGIIFEKVEKRKLPFSRLGYRTVGRVNEENRGMVGLEYSFNRQLAGKDGKALYQKMVGGGQRPVFDGSEVAPVDGLDIETTLNVNLQDITEDALLKALTRHKADYGVAVLMEVATGEIKSMSNLSRDARGNYWETYNYAVGSQGAREPGSTFKLASMIALFEEKDIALADTVHTGNGVYHFFDEVMKDHKPGGYGVLTVQEVFEKSSNIGTAKLISHHFQSNPQKYVDYLSKMGLSQPLGFQMVGEGKPYIKTPKDSTWSGTTLPWMSHGYELKMTPLQTLTLFNAVANNGQMVQPLIVKSVRKADKILEQFETKVLNDKICSANTLKKVRQMLEGVVERGTAKNIFDSQYRIAGKTGTAKKVKNGKYINQYYTSFAGYFPAGSPRYSCIVVIDNPKGFNIYGSDVAAPVFKDIVDKIAALEVDLQDYMSPSQEEFAGVFPVIRSGNHDDLKYLCNELGISNHSQAAAESWVKTRISGKSVFWTPNEVHGMKVPDVRGMTLRDALFVLENIGIEVQSKGRGRVSTQSLMPGTKVNEQTKIRLTLG